MRIARVLLLVLLAAAVGCEKHLHNNLPPSEMLMHPGPGVDGPGPGVMTYQPPPAPVGATSQVHFVGPEGMTIQWDVTMPGRFDSESLVAPARYNFPQGFLYRLKLANIPGRPGVELYPTLELGLAVPRTEAFLAHNAVPMELTEDDFDQVMSGNFVTKVIYLPDPEFQELALAGVGTLVSTRLDPGVDPIVEADRRGAIMAIVRLGNKDLQIQSGSAEAAAWMQQAGYQMPGQPPCMLAFGGVMPPPAYVAGVSSPQYGMPITGTPIGLPGPPHVPLGVPAGLQRHTIVNHTHVEVPGPSRNVRIDVKQKPGLSYPVPANRAWIVEKASPSPGITPQPMAERHQAIGTGVAAPAAPCPAGGDPPMAGGATSSGSVMAASGATAAGEAKIGN
ncbi:MAG: hypothetical protein ABSF26_16715 [Thermoguttaceae bacterium]|jgi:hypothetical protein